MNCPICNYPFIKKDFINISSLYSDDISIINMKHNYCINCNNQYLTDKQWNKYNQYYYEHVSNILIKKYINGDEWIDIKNIDIDESLIPFYVFFKNINKTKYILKESYEKYKRCKNGFFWIGKNYKNFKINDDFYDSLFIEKINDNKIYINNKWISIKNIKLNNIKFYGYGGIIFNDNNTISNYDLIRSNL